MSSFLVKWQVPNGKYIILNTELRTDKVDQWKESLDLWILYIVQGDIIHASIHVQYTPIDSDGKRGFSIE